MQLIFERGDRTAPVGHALIYFQGNAGTILATYVTVPPIAFDVAKFLPGFLAGAMQGLDLNSAMVATPMPPIPEEVPGLEYLQGLAARRQDDLIFAGGAASDPMQLAAETAEAARLYGELYSEGAPQSQAVQGLQEDSEPVNLDTARFADLDERQKLDELTRMTGRLRDAVNRGEADPELELQMRGLASVLPAKYRMFDLIEAALIPGERGQRLAELYLERCYKLFHEDYLDLERIDRAIEAARS